MSQILQAQVKTQGLQWRKYSSNLTITLSKTFLKVFVIPFNVHLIVDCEITSGLVCLRKDIQIKSHFDEGQPVFSACSLQEHCRTRAHWRAVAWFYRSARVSSQLTERSNSLIIAQEMFHLCWSNGSSEDCTQGLHHALWNGPSRNVKVNQLTNGKSQSNSNTNYLFIQCWCSSE